MAYGVATNNPFDLLGDENEAPEASAARASAEAAKAQAAQAAELKKASDAKMDKPGETIATRQSPPSHAPPPSQEIHHRTQNHMPTHTMRTRSLPQGSLVL